MITQLSKLMNLLYKNAGEYIKKLSVISSK